MTSSSLRFREDLYYRLNTVPIYVPPLRERREDIPLLFRKFATDVATQYRMPPITLDDEARRILEAYPWPGNIRQLKNVAEQISAIEESRLITPTLLSKYLPVPATAPGNIVLPRSTHDMDPMTTERELLYKVLFDMRADINDLRRMFTELSRAAASAPPVPSSTETLAPAALLPEATSAEPATKADLQREQIVRALKKHHGRRREAAQELFMSERTLYRKIKELGIDETY